MLIQANRTLVHGRPPVAWIAAAIMYYDWQTTDKSGAQRGTQ